MRRCQASEDLGHGRFAWVSENINSDDTCLSLPEASTCTTDVEQELATYVILAIEEQDEATSTWLGQPVHSMACEMKEDRMFS